MSAPLRLRYPTQPPSPHAVPDVDASPPPELDRARALMHQQKARSTAFASVQTLFQDPAWDILLALFVAYEEGTPLTIHAVRAATGLSEVTIRRWLLTLEHRGLITCWPQSAALSQRSLGLTDDALTMMLHFLQEI